MPELNFVSTSAADTAGAQGLQLQPYMFAAKQGLNYGGAQGGRTGGQLLPAGDGFMEYGSGTPGSLPFRVDQAGNVTAASVSPSTVGLRPSGDVTGAKDLANINAAIAALSAGGVLLLSPGTFYVNAAIVLPSGVSVQGSGMNATIINQVSTTAHGLYSADNYRYGEIRDLQIVGPASGTGDGIHFDKSTAGPADLLLANLFIRTMGGHGVYLNTAIVSTLIGVRSQSNGGDGFHTVGGTSMSFLGCYANGNTGKGYYLSGTPSYCSLTGCACDSNAIAYQVDSGHAISFQGCGCEANTGNNFVISGGTNNTLQSCTVSNNAAIAFWVTSSALHASLIGCLENSVSGSPTASIQVDAGCTATLIDSGTATAKSLAANTTNQISTSDIYLASTGTGSLTADRAGNASNLASLILSTAAAQKWAVQLRNDSTEDLHIRDVADGLELIYGQKRATQLNMGLLGEPSGFGSGVGVIFIANDSTDPTGNPTGGGFLYVSGGALKYRGSSGTVTVLGPA
jgi:hypothetical protein